MRAGDPGIEGDDRDFVAVGYIAGTHGLRGQVKVIPLTDVPDRFTTLKKVYIETRSGEMREYSIESVRRGKGALIIAFSSMSFSEAEEISGGYIKVPESEVPELEEGCYYHFQILGMEVWTEDGRSLGKISEIITTGGNDVYVVKDQEREYLIPAIRDVIREVDAEGKRMIITVIEGLI